MSGCTSLGARHARLVERLGWWYLPLAFVFWVLLWPIGLTVLAVALVQRERAVRRDPELRVRRLLAWYPPAWRERHGEAMGELLRDALADGRGGLPMTLDVAQAGIEARMEAMTGRGVYAALALSLGSIPLFPQGLVPLVMTFTGHDDRSWFLALYAPDALQRPVAVGMMALGATLLVTGWRIARPLRLSPAAGRTARG